MRSLVIFLVAASMACALGEKPRPVTKVVNLLRKMEEELIQDQKRDEENVQKFKCWCKTGDEDKTQAINDAQVAITKLTATIEFETGNSAKLSAQIAQLHKDITENEQKMADAKALREKQLAKFNEDEKDAMLAIQACKSAITVLSRVQGGRQGKKEAFVSVANIVSQLADGYAARYLSNVQAEELNSFVQSSKDFFNARNIHGSSYDNKSGTIFGILKEMKDQMQRDLDATQKGEIENAKNFADIKQTLTEEHDQLTETLAQKEEDLATSQENKQNAIEDLENTREQLGADQAFLMDLKMKCQKFDQEWERRQKERADEIKAVQEAVQILDSDEAQGTFTATYASPATFLELSSYQKGAVDRAAAALTIKAQALHAPQLALMAQSIKMRKVAGAFDKVFAAIDKMVADLNQKKQDEVVKRDWCIKTFHELDLSRTNNDKDIEESEAKMEMLDGEIKVANESLEQTLKNIEEMQAAMEAATKDRKEQNEVYQQNTQDSKQAVVILNQAKDKLANFYQNQKQNAALLQQAPKADPDAAPAGFGDYKRKGGKGIIAMIQGIIEETEATIQQYDMDEKDALAAFDGFMADADRSMNAYNKQKTTLEEQIANQTEELQQTTKERDEQVLEKEEIANQTTQTHRECDFLQKNFDIRQTKFNQEVEALRNAKDILKGALAGGDSFLQRRI